MPRRNRESDLVTTLKALGVGLGIFGVYLLLHLSERGDADDVRTVVVTWIDASPKLAENRDYVLTLLDHHHNESFTRNHTRARRHRPADFDVEGYMRLVVNSMAREAERDGRQVVAGAMEELLREFLHSTPR